MRNLLHVLMLLFVLTTMNVYGQETFAPLIDDNTVLFVHIDLRKVEIDTLKSQTEKLGEEFLNLLHFDEKSIKATTRELKVELEKLDAIIRPPYETITKTFDIRELAFIADTNLIENNITGVLVIPWKGKTKNDVVILQTFLKTFSQEIPSFIVTDDFLFFLFPITGHPEELDEVTKLTLIAWLQNITPSKDSRIQQGLKVLGQNEIKIVATLPEKFKAKLIPNALSDNALSGNVPREIQGLLLFAAQKIEWVAASLPINTLLSGETENIPLLTVKTPKRTDAVQLRSLLESAIEFGINAVRQRVEPGNQSFLAMPLGLEFAKGMLRTLLPDIEEDKLVFWLKGENAVVKQKVIASCGIAAALLFPAIQASQDAASRNQQRMQCMNKLKQIALGIHNYHDTHGTLPPLYTVDKDGKPLHSWRVLILPFIEQVALYQQIRHNEPWDSEYNKQFHNVVVNTYCCPVNPLVRQIPGACCYSVIAGEGFIPAKKAGTQTSETFARIVDGTSNTLAVVEVKTPFCWMDPTADVTLEELLKGINKKEGRVGSFHVNPDGIYVAFFDGSCRFLSSNISKELLKALGTCAGGESVTISP
ncbi:MAG: DUF1559 domain-containing protein [Planctomycetaceae bacterium]|jgi:hypothetical protein|nr:DUF1559 domain-containing protein [Planctomycetaceae bacterium]